MVSRCYQLWFLLRLRRSPVSQSHFMTYKGGKVEQVLPKFFPNFSPTKMRFWEEKKIAMFSASYHKMFLGLWACVKKDLLKDCRLSWNISLHKFVQSFFIRMNWKCLLSTEQSWNVWSFSLLQTQLNRFAAREHRSVQTSLSVHSNLIAFCALLVCRYYLCMPNTSVLCCGSIFATVMSSLADKDIFLSRVDMIVCSHADVIALNDVAVCNPSVSIYCCLFLPWITD